MTFWIIENDFVRDGEPIQLISGAMHYFRTHPDQWRDRLRKMRACGLNCVETYVPWNLHEPRPGEFCFEGFCDIEGFVREAAAQDLMVIVRPGPFICAEWEGGGLPWWLNTISGIELRCNNKLYLDCVERFFTALLPRLRPLLCTNGGPIIAMQVENEYGSYGNDKGYLERLRDGLRGHGVDVLLFTSDGPEDWMLEGGTLPDLLKTANFARRPTESFQILRKHQATGPMMCMEFWNGWFDHWGEAHHTRPTEATAQVLDEMLVAGASVNFYMFHGGTNFGFMNGANLVERVQPTITSYDYDSPLSEAGDLTPKYAAFREVISKYVDLPDIEAMNSPKRGYGVIAMTESASLLDNLDPTTKISNATTLSMDEIDQGYGFILYRTTVDKDRADFELIIDGLHDRAAIMINGEFITTIEYNATSFTAKLSVKAGDTLDILVENLGRVNYGSHILNHGGIHGHVRFGQQIHFGWDIYPLPMTDLSKVEFSPCTSSSTTPGYYRGTLMVDEVADTFLDIEGWTKGILLLNGFNLGRYWNVGPQRTLYVPAPLLKQGRNELVAFELHGSTRLDFRSIDQPELGC